MRALTSAGQRRRRPVPVISSIRRTSVALGSLPVLYSWLLNYPKGRREFGHTLNRDDPAEYLSEGQAALDFGEGTYHLVVQRREPIDVMTGMVTGCVIL
jgi:hypothetical protein